MLHKFRASLSIEGNAPRGFDVDATSILPTATVDGLARACDGTGDVLDNALQLAMANPPGGPVGA